jgi:hypothetical protein
MTAEKLSGLIQLGVSMPKKSAEEIKIWRIDVFDPIIHALRDESETVHSIPLLPESDKLVMLDILQYLVPIAKRQDITDAYYNICDDLGKEPKQFND